MKSAFFVVVIYVLTRSQNIASGNFNKYIIEEKRLLHNEIFQIVCIAASVKPWPVRICAEYIAAGMNDMAVTDSSVTESPDYKYDDDDENSRSSEESDTAVEYSRPVRKHSFNDRSYFNDIFDLQIGVVQCTRAQQFCFSVWKVDHQGNATIVRQGIMITLSRKPKTMFKISGCWQTDDQQTNCLNTKCINAMRTISNNHRFCCCSGTMCNQNTTTTEIDNLNDGTDKDRPYTLVQTTVNRPALPLHPSNIWMSPIVWICVSMTAIMIISAVIFLACNTIHKAEPELAPLAPSGPGYSSNMYNVDNLKLCAMIGQGKYGTVWKGMVNEKAVAVKIFPGQYKQYFINEKNIYSLSFMDSPSLLEYYGAYYFQFLSILLIDSSTSATNICVVSV